MKVIVYVERPSDKLAMRSLLRGLIEQKRGKGVEIEFFDTHKGDAKGFLLNTLPKRVANILLNDHDALVAVVPDLYPKNKGFKHDTVSELAKGILKNFEDALRARAVPDNSKVKERFKFFCFKYDMEALILASEEALKARLHAETFKVDWHRTVEEQNNDYPPRIIVEQLFKGHGMRYNGPTDAPLILGRSSYQELAKKCYQCFGPFVAFLEGL